jgi:hypothetical protein
MLCRMPMPSASNSAVLTRMIRTWRVLGTIRDVSGEAVMAVMEERLRQGRAL